MEEKLFQVGRDCIIYQDKYRAVGKNGMLNLRNKVPFIQFPTLKSIDFVKHGFSTRLGGVSEGHCATMNLGYTRGDKPEDVTENYKRICRAMEIPMENLVFSDQIHETNIKVVTKEDTIADFMEEFTRGEKKLTDFDGLITNQAGVALVTSYADCVPLFFVDPVKKAIGLSHSGWRGTVKKMGARTVEKMQAVFGTSPEDLICVIGPSICQDCYEVSRDVFLSFQAVFTEEQVEEILLPTGKDKYQLDLWKANRIILREAGVLREHISVANICTCCNSGLLFSHRKTGGVRGSLQGFLMIEE